MKNRNIFILLVIISMGSFSSPLWALTPAEKLHQEIQRIGVQAVTDRDYKPGLLKHVVSFQYKEGVTEEQKKEIQASFLALQTLALRPDGKPYILSIERGIQNSAEGADQDLEDIYIVTFRSQGDRNYYVGQPIVSVKGAYDPAHQKFKEKVGPLLKKAVVVDFCIAGMSYLQGSD